MQASSVKFSERPAAPWAPARAWESSRLRLLAPAIGTYLVEVPQPSLDVRRANFGAFVQRAMTAAHNRGMSIGDIVEATGVGKSTIYRWRDGDWAKDPRASQVRAFCEGLGLSLEAAQAALGWLADRPSEPEPLQNPLLVELAQRLEDPHVPATEKAFIEESLRMLIARGLIGRRRGVTR